MSISENPLIILHDKIQEVQSGASPRIKFRLNPKFAESSASVFYKLDSADEFSEITATLNAGIWSVILPEITENFSYYLSGSSVSGNFQFDTTLPESAPEELFYVECQPVGHQEENIEPGFSLSNYPNPFTASGSADGNRYDQVTTISFSITDDALVDLSVFNIKGQRIRKLEESFYRKGTHLIGWNGKDDSGRAVGSGIYLFRLSIDDKMRRISKGLLLK
ncbi:MAG: FlgD immunoglobulin-like domain containing protein [Candidatus Cloacimonetes bacterium]|nr:FlgD immunoglobulin-like domain containing protein [Candidatus Cloacimonadota bacterium]